MIPTLREAAHVDIGHQADQGEHRDDRRPAVAHERKRNTCDRHDAHGHANALEDLEGENVEIDKLAEKVKRAIELIKSLRSKLKKTEVEIKEIVKDFETS